MMRLAVILAAALALAPRPDDVLVKPVEKDSAGLYSYGIDAAKDSAAVERFRVYTDSIRSERPVVALVLSGGGAKGAAHVGVLCRLEELGIPVDFIVGTSMGGLVGGLYCLGKTTEDIVSLLRTSNWNILLRDEVPRDYLSFYSVKYSEKYNINIPFYYARKRESVKQNFFESLPAALTHGHNVSNLLRSNAIGYNDPMDFLDLPIPFVCVATDMVSYKAKVWYSGEIGTAMRSTMSIPGLFDPVWDHGMVLVDGGLRNNYPVDIARNLGADIVIGVTLAEDDKTFSEVNNIGDLFMQLISLPGDDKYRENENLADVTLHPDVTGYNMLSFSSSAIQDLLGRGYSAALSADSLLNARVVDRVGTRPKQLRHREAMNLKTAEITVDTVMITGVSVGESRLLQKKLKEIRADNKTVNYTMLNDAVATIFGTHAFEQVLVDVSGKGEPYSIEIKGEKGPVHQFGFGARVDSDEAVSVLLNVGLGKFKLTGHILDFTAKISYCPRLNLVYSFTSPYFPTVNVAASANWMFNSNNVFQTADMGINYFSHKEEVYLSALKMKYFDIAGGVRNQYFRVNEFTPAGFSVPERFGRSYRQDLVSAFFHGEWNTFDNGYFPKSGVKLDVNYEWVFAGLLKNEKVRENHINMEYFHTLSFTAKGVVPMGRIVSFIPYGNFRFIFGEDISPICTNIVGGFIAGRYISQQIPFVGVQYPTARGDKMAILGADLRVNVAGKHYLTAMFNYVRDSGKFVNFFTREAGDDFGAGLEYAYDSKVGPLKANFNWSTITNKLGFYISAGFDF